MDWNKYVKTVNQDYHETIINKQVDDDADDDDDDAGDDDDDDDDDDDEPEIETMEMII